MRRKLKHILVPVDGSDSASRAAEWAVSLAEQTGAAVTLLYVFPVTAAERRDIESQPAERVAAWRERVSREPFERTGRLVGDTPATVHQEMALGEPPAEIVAYARQVRADLIVMGSRGTSALTGELTGSLSIEVLHQTEIPVTIIH